MKVSREQRLAGQVAVITGASSGIGAAIALRLGREGLNLVLTARREERLNEVAEACGRDRTLVLPADLEEPEERIRLMAQAEAHFGQVDILVNNAGFGWYGYFADMPWEAADALLRVNVAAAAHLAHLALPAMRARRQGHILVVSSVAGEIPSQGVALYSASKACLNAWTTALHRECAGSGVRVTCLKPGPVKTEFFPNVRQAEGSRHIPVERLAVPAERVAEAAWRALLRPRRQVYIPGILALTPWVELSFGWLMDRVGPLLLRWSDHSGKTEGSGSAPGRESVPG